MDRFRILSFFVVLGLLWLGLLVGYFSFLPGWRGLDFLLTAGQIEASFARWSAEDIAYHIFGTRTIDAVFPALYGVVLTVVACRYWTGFKRIAMVALTLISVVADYTENALSIQILNGDMSVVSAHVWATWIKFTAISLPMKLGLAYWFREWRARKSAAKG